jgi:hypothetical protein
MGIEFLGSAPFGTDFTLAKFVRTSRKRRGDALGERNLYEFLDGRQRRSRA